MANVPLNVDDVYRIVSACRIPTQLSLNRFDVQVLSFTAGATDTQLVNGWDFLVAPLYKVLMTNGATYYGSKAYRILPAPVNPPVVATLNTGPGTGGADPLPTQVSGIISKLSSAFGRGRNGRIYVGFPDVSMLNAEEPSAAYLANLAALGLATMRNPVVTNGGITIHLQCGVWSPAVYNPDGSLRRAAGYNQLLYPDYRVDAAWATQRRRGDYGRPNVPNPF